MHERLEGEGRPVLEELGVGLVLVQLQALRYPAQLAGIEHEGKKQIQELKLNKS